MRILVGMLAATFSTVPGLWAATPDTPVTGKLVIGPTLYAVNSAGVRARSTPQGTPVTIFDSLTGATTLTFTGGTPRTFMGDPFTTATGTGSTVIVDEATVFLGSIVAQSFSNGLVINVQFYDTFDGANATAVFSNPVGGVQTFTVPGPVTLTALSANPINLVFTPPLTFSGLENGFDINYQGDNGGGPASTDNMTSVIRVNGALAVGSFTTNGGFAPPQFGFYRNVAGQTNFNHPGTDLRVFAAGNNDIMLALQLRGNVVPVELQKFDVQ